MTVNAIMFEVGGPMNGQEYVPILRERVRLKVEVLAWWGTAPVEERAATLQRVADSYGERFFAAGAVKLDRPLEGQARASETIIDDEHPPGIEWLV